jgi:hypothetical protein
MRSASRGMAERSEANPQSDPIKNRDQLVANNADAQ